MRLAFPSLLAPRPLHVRDFRGSFRYDYGAQSLRGDEETLHFSYPLRALELPRQLESNRDVPWNGTAVLFRAFTFLDPTAFGDRTAYGRFASIGVSA